MAEAAFKIDGIEYEIPSLETFDMDEAMILYDHCGLTLEDFAVDEDDPDQMAELEKKGRNPGFIRALMIIAFIRGNRGVSRTKAELVIGKVNLFEQLKSFFSQPTEDPTSPQKSDGGTTATSASSDLRTSSSGPDSTESSDAEKKSAPIIPLGTDAGSVSPAEIPAPTGIGA